MKVFDPMNSGYIYRDAFFAALGVYELSKPSSEFVLTKVTALDYLKNKIATLKRLYSKYLKNPEIFLARFSELAIQDEIAEEMDKKLDFTQFLATVPFFLKQPRTIETRSKSLSD